MLRYAWVKSPPSKCPAAAGKLIWMRESVIQMHLAPTGLSLGAGVRQRCGIGRITRCSNHLFQLLFMVLTANEAFAGQERQQQSRS